MELNGYLMRILWSIEKIFPTLEQRNEDTERPQKWSEKMKFYDKGGDLKIGWNTATQYQYVYLDLTAEYYLLTL